MSFDVLVRDSETDPAGCKTKVTTRANKLYYGLIQTFYLNLIHNGKTSVNLLRYLGK